MELLIPMLLIIFGPLILCFFLYKWLRRKRSSKAVYFIPIGLALAYGYVWFDAFFPSDSFYKEEFTKLSNLPFPVTGSITKKSASYPDQHGDFSACAQVEVSPREFDGLLKQFSNDTSYSYDSTGFVGSSEFYRVTNKLPERAFLSRFSKGDSGINAYFFVGFLTDRKTIIIYRASS